jgi:hypothetical protein
MRRTNATTAVLLGTLALLLTGCGRNPVSPQLTAPGDFGSSSFGGTQTEDPAPPMESQPGATAALSVAANGEGSVTVGRFSLKVHKNSLRRAASITLTVASPDAMQVEITVTPAEANDFQVPIELVADLSDRPDLNLDNQTLYWWDGDWQAADDVTVQHGDRDVKARSRQLLSAKVDQRALSQKGREQN